MAKKIDPFDKFKEATLGKSSELSAAIANKRSDDASSYVSPAVPETREETLQSPQAKISKNAARELVSFHIPKDLKKKLGLLKYESERSFGELYIEAIEDLLKKYGKI